jgi:DNA-binding PadR family transcriptional regulator
MLNLFCHTFSTVQVLAIQTRLETLPSLGETIVLQIINSNQPVTGYQIRKQFIQTTKRGLSFGTLVPMLQRFEKSQLVIRVRESEDEGLSYNWFITPGGIRELETRLDLMVRMLKASKGRSDDELISHTDVPKPEMQEL